MGFNIERADKPFVVKSPYKPSGDQPQAIAELAERIENGENDVVLMGATGTGKTATTAWLIEKLQRPTLIIEPNKTLAAQLCAEFRELMPDNAVSYFVSYYDYYQPEAYIPQTDTYIEKDSNINDDVERLRHQATANLLTRRDCVVVATVSCIYGLGTPEEYAGRMLFLKVGQEINRDDLLRQFVAMQYKRNDIAFTRGTFRVRGDTVEIIPVYEELAVRIEFFGDEIDRISTLHPLTGDEIDEENEVHIFPASHYVAGPERMERALKTIREELDERLAELRKQGKELEAQRLNMRTTYDLEMLTQVGVCSGVENYSRHFDGRAAGTPPHTLLDFFPDDFLLVIDESHVTVPQIGAMYEAMPPASARWSNTASACPPRWTTDHSNGRNSCSASARPCTCPPRQATMRWDCPMGWSNRLSAQPVCWTRRSTYARSRGRSTICSPRSRPVWPRTSARWSPL